MLWALTNTAWLVCSGEEGNDRLAIFRSTKGPNNETGRFTREDFRETN